MIEFTDDNFTTEVLQADRPVVVHFWAPWNGIDNMVKPIILKLAAEFYATVKIGTLNVEKYPATADTYELINVPTFLIFKNGKVACRSIGFTPETRLRELVAQAVTGGEA